MCVFYISPSTQDINHLINDNYLCVSNLSNSLYYKSDIVFDEIIKNKRVIIIGDFWGVPDMRSLDLDEIAYKRIIEQIKGTYYFFIIENESICCFTGFLGLYPIYYSKETKIVTNIINLFIKSEDELKICDQFILESFLFNYSFGNKTIYETVKLLDTHNILAINNEFSLSYKSGMDITDLFVDTPTSNRVAYKNLSNLFIETVNDYVPDKGAIISFTGGFDGRTIVSAALKCRKLFDSFSFGKHQNDDVYIPERNAAALNLKYINLQADQNYVSDEYKNNAIEIINNSVGFNGFLYSHFLHMSKILKTNYKYLITGFGGSELLRSTHIMGAVTSEALYQVLTIDSRVELRSKLLESKSLLFLNPHLTNKNIDKVLDDIFVFKKQVESLDTLNKKQYVYILTETLRKVFGVWQFNQARYIKVRSPYLDFTFIRALFKTDLAGVYNAFFTENPIKRFKGQLLYAIIIKATNTMILNQVTGKGYKPKSLLSLHGKVSLMYPFIKKRLTRKFRQEDLDNLSIVSGIKKVHELDVNLINDSNFDKISKIFNLELFHNELNSLTPFTDEKKRDALLYTRSILQILAQ